MDLLPALNISPKTGQEPFINNGHPLPLTLLNFWQWSSSDLVNNALRGVLAEFIVASALGCQTPVRTEWDAYDLQTAEGIKVEVKSAAYLQSWAQKKLSSIQFNIKPTHGWDNETESRSLNKVGHRKNYPPLSSASNRLMVGTTKRKAAV